MIHADRISFASALIKLLRWSPDDRWGFSVSSLVAYPKRRRIDTLLYDLKNWKKPIQRPAKFATTVL
jgi:hypothetical protein